MERPCKNRFIPYKSAKNIDFLPGLPYNYAAFLYLPETQDDKIAFHVEPWCAMNDICEYLGVSRDTVLAWIEKREMPATKIGRLWKFKISEVDAWMKSGVAAEK